MLAHWFRGFARLIRVNANSLGEARDGSCMRTLANANACSLQISQTLAGIFPNLKSRTTTTALSTSAAHQFRKHNQHVETQSY